MNTLGQRIKLIRKSKNLKQDKFGELFDVKLGAVSAWETDAVKPTAETIMKMCELFNVTPNYLLTGEDKNALNKEEAEIIELCRTDEDIKDTLKKLIDLKKKIKGMILIKRWEAWDGIERRINKSKKKWDGIERRNQIIKKAEVIHDLKKLNS